MRTDSARRRTRHLQMGVPAAVLGTLAGALVAAPADAAVTQPIERPHSPVARTAPAATPPVSYQVRPGDTVSAIADRFGLRTADVLAWNGLSWRSVIYPGQALRLTSPRSAAPATTTPKSTSTGYKVVAGDTVFGIAKKHGTTVDAILRANGLTRASIIYPGQMLTVSSSAPSAAAAPAAAPSAAGKTHTVVAGDTLFGIARTYRTTTQALFAANGLSATSVIYPGQKIRVAAAAAPAPTTVSTTLDAEQAANARNIIRIGRELGVSDRGIAIALATSMVESWMRNLDWGDRDSVGLFQQRPSTGWGTASALRDPAHSIRLFYGGPHDPNGANTRGLLDIPGWESMGFSAAAQAVQISAYPNRYGQWEKQAYQWLALYG